MYPEIRPDRYTVAVAGPNSTGKSELARQISCALRTRVDTTVVHVGDMFRFFAELPGALRLNTPEQIQKSAREALEEVRCECDSVTGEIHLKPNGFDRFLQSAGNGHAGSRLGGNEHLAEFVTDFVCDLFHDYLGNNGIALVDGREKWGADLVIRTNAEPPVQRAFFYQERPEAQGWHRQTVEDTIKERDTLDAAILAPVQRLTANVIDVYRTDQRVSATQRVGKQLAGIIYERYAHRFDTKDYPTMKIVDR